MPWKNWGYLTTVTSPEDILSAEKIIFPGVGNYENMIEGAQPQGYMAPLPGNTGLQPAVFRHLSGYAGIVSRQ